MLYSVVVAGRVPEIYDGDIDNRRRERHPPSRVLVPF